MPYLVLVDKPQGITSFGAVAALRKKLNEKRIGHTGTLDPMATGVLPLLTGRASRLCSIMLDSEKEYIAAVRLGITTDTLDITGKTLSQTPVPSITDDELLGVLKSFCGNILQIPPMYSAIKKDGKRLYQLARDGVEVERAPREVTVFSIELLNRNSNTDFTFSVRCSKGTYVRSLCDDIGKALGTGAVLTSLRRTYAAGFNIKECTPLDDIMKSDNDSFLKSPELCVKHLKEVFVSEAQAARFCHGGQLSFNRLGKTEFLKSGELFRVKLGCEFLGIGEADLEKEELKVKFIL